MRLGGRETLDDLTIVFRTVRQLGTNQVSPRNLGGPWTIIQMAMQHADQGTAKLLAVPHLAQRQSGRDQLPAHSRCWTADMMVFLVYEGIRGKPANERVQVVLTYIGLVFIIGLMVWVCGLDFGLISRLVSQGPK